MSYLNKLRRGCCKVMKLLCRPIKALDYAMIWWVVVIWEFSVMLWSKPFTFELKFWNWTKPNKNGQSSSRYCILKFDMIGLVICKLGCSLTENPSYCNKASYAYIWSQCYKKRFLEHQIVNNYVLY